MIALGQPLVELLLCPTEFDGTKAGVLKPQRFCPQRDLLTQMVDRLVVDGPAGNGGVLLLGHSRYDNPMDDITNNLYRATQVQVLDRTAIDEYGIEGDVLMVRAGRSAYELLRRLWPEARRIVVLCGSGNNGGDGFVLARLAFEAGLEVTVYQLGDVHKIQNEALVAYQAMKKVGVEPQLYEGQSLVACDLIVDAMLGIGLNGVVSGQWQAAIEAVNKSGRPVLAIDIPSGLDADTGLPLGSAVKADHTLSFIALKQGLFTAAGPEYAGKVRLDGLDLPPNVYQHVPPSCQLMHWSSDWCKTILPPRRRDAHKGDSGHVLLIGGDHGTSGAIQMAGEAAMRSGAGLVTLATRSRHAVILSVQRPELMSQGMEEVGDIVPLLSRVSVIAVGPGLGKGEWARRFFPLIVKAEQPKVLDADALNLLAESPSRSDNWILTPHPGEAARLLDTNIAEVQSDRFYAVRELQKRYGGVVVLKGAGSLVIDSTERIYLCPEGNPGMASGGMGDVLTGIIAALLAQGLSLNQAAKAGVCLHAAAGDMAAVEGERGMLASDLFAYLRHLVNLHE